MANVKKTSAEFTAELKNITGEDALKVFALAVIAAYASAEEEISSAEQIISDQEQLVEKTKLSNPNYRPEIKSKSGVFRINHPVRQGEDVRDIEYIAGNPKLIEELYKSGSTAVTILTED